MIVLNEFEEKLEEKLQTSETFLLSSILAFSGGFQDANTYNVRDKVFSNAQTGNVVLMSQHIMMGDFMSGYKVSASCACVCCRSAYCGTD